LPLPAALEGGGPMPFKKWPFAFGGGALDASVASCCMYAAISLSIVSMFAMNMGFITNTLERLSLFFTKGSFKGTFITKPFSLDLKCTMAGN
jgi:hypothetical protein